jgi:hypothetical protein
MRRFLGGLTCFLALAACARSAASREGPPTQASPVSTPSGKMGSTAPPSLDPHCLSADRPGLITCEEAIRRAKHEGGYGTAYPYDAQIKPYHVHRGSKPILAWVVTWHDVDRELEGGTAYPPPCAIGEDGVVLDAHTGEFIVEGFSGTRVFPCVGPTSATR